MKESHRHAPRRSWNLRSWLLVVRGRIDGAGSSMIWRSLFRTLCPVEREHTLRLASLCRRFAIWMACGYPRSEGCPRSGIVGLCLAAEGEPRVLTNCNLDGAQRLALWRLAGIVRQTVPQRLVSAGVGGPLGALAGW